MRVIVLTNPAAGAKADVIHELEAALRDAGVSAEIRQVPGDRMTEIARELIKEAIDAVVAAGGDGTISACAAALAGSDMPLGVLPRGTLNHFAKDLNIPADLPQAAQVIAANHVRLVDVGEVNGRVFINNSSIGIYPHMVGKRDRQRERLGRGKWIAMLLACISVFRRYPTVRVRIGLEDKTVLGKTPFVFVGNNRYEMTLTTLGTRSRLDGGELSLYYANVRGRFGLFMLAVRAVLGRLEQSEDFESQLVPEIWIETSKRELRVAIDGEVTRMATPLHYQIRPKALRVLVPREDATGGGGSAS